ncbi:cell division cycle-associated protein 4 isoform X1 [Hypomesus transpacificus]|uniref:cell division cycle-associated protein 4 isoform X1 n=2 Tax=Hypomesus transpacificus TaxID=137520 RepID=UPI001F0844DA|nr:cell division cycle-associated protein 4 isoform X1 [Hypomesus transpacificus]XP_046877824.1 cell division cycle-associated protein 4 isoform X1 [Hypomesus transpacificus]XP_046877825.1 cell division cycle-associated protein 4 isoform X1 [Hypomesus transpacificus]XP_046877827.1 cell division cycle-associated protein 4 isoform X1 [Hypomesus transpacificus]XP_046877828.1 cell division cycle-associated protein 4 isoform X1 [Hypomesus transpacificus]XP_046877829.1 cell division cycle-associated
MSKRGSRLVYMPVRRRRKRREKTTMYSKGTKRKFADGADAVAGGNPEGPKMAPYSLQRQSLLDMSLIKLQLCHMLVEPNLCRSVLIANTVRQIQEEMTHDGSWQVVTDAFASSGQSSSERLVATEVLCRSSGLEQDAGPKLFSVMGYDGCHEEEVVTDEALCSVAISDGATTCLLGTIGHCWERAELRAEAELENGATEDSGFGDDDDEEELSGQESKMSTGKVFGKFEIKNNNPGSDAALEELFSDVDASYYDLDTMLTGMQSAPKMGPYDLLDSLASSHGPASNSSCRADLNELDHIMEIIVGS